MPKKATAAEAEIVLKLYDLRREPEMRKARNWWVVEFWPTSADDVMKIANDLGSQQNNWLRQVGGYWDMAAALVLHGAISAELFLEGGISGEMVFVYAKMQPFLKEIREKMQMPAMFSNIEKVITQNKAGRERLKMVSARIEARRKAMGAKA